MGWEPSVDAGLCFVRSTGVRPVRYLQAEKVRRLRCEVPDDLLKRALVPTQASAVWPLPNGGWPSRVKTVGGKVNSA